MALEYAKKYPDAVSHLVLLAMSPVVAQKILLLLIVIFKSLFVHKGSLARKKFK